MQILAIDAIEPNQHQPRERFDDIKLAELAQSIRSLGVIQPITVSALQGGKYRIIAGERRWRAAVAAGLKEIPAMVRSVEKQEALEMALIENIQREDLNPIEIALGFARLCIDHQLTHDQVAQKTGKDRSTVSNFLRLLKLTPEVRQELIDGTLTMGHAKALVNIPDPERQKSLCAAIKERQLSVRETEDLVRQITNPAPAPAQAIDKKEASEEVDPNIRAAVEEMSMALGTKVKLIARNAKSGRLEVEYYSPEDLDRIYSVIVKQ